MIERVKLSANVLFSGIGCQEQGIKDSNLFNLNVVCTSDINKDSILTYAVLHCGLTKELIESYQNYPDKQQMIDELQDKNIGYNFKSNRCYNWKNINDFDLHKYWLAMKLSNNLGDITKIKELPYADLWTVSFPCTNISLSGRLEGLDKNSDTSSSLVWQQIRLLKLSVSKNEAPKFIIFENVKNLISPLFIHSFNLIINELKQLGYNYYYKVINSKDCGLPQNRERVYVLCIRNDVDNEKFEFPLPFDKNIRIVDILNKDENSNDNLIIARYLPNTDKNKQVYNSHKLFPMLIPLYNKYTNQRPNEIITLFHIKSNAIENKIANEKLCQGNMIYDINGISPTVTAQGGGLGKHSGLYLCYDDINNCYVMRCLSGIENLRLMGIYLNDLQLKVIQDLNISKYQLSFQAGNGIATNVIKLLFEHLYKALYDNAYVCEDEKLTKNRNRKLF